MRNTIWWLRTKLVSAGLVMFFFFFLNYLINIYVLVFKKNL